MPSATPSSPSSCSCLRQPSPALRFSHPHSSTVTLLKRHQAAPEPGGSLPKKQQTGTRASWSGFPLVFLPLHRVILIFLARSAFIHFLLTLLGMGFLTSLVAVLSDRVAAHVAARPSFPVRTRGVCTCRNLSSKVQKREKGGKV